MVQMITTKEAARLLQVDPRTLRKYETPDGRWCEVLGLRFKVFRLGLSPLSQRRYDRDEILRALARARRAE
ncbi:MAG: hypothetical protein ACOY94_13125 [Bacillota bacterium]